MEKPKPVLQHERDAIVKVTLRGIEVIENLVGKGAKHLTLVAHARVIAVGIGSLSRRYW